VQAAEALLAAGIELIPVSGRPAGEVAGVARYLPGVRRAVAENGLLAIVPDAPPRWLGPATDRAALKAVGDWLRATRDPDLRITGDDAWRLGDVAYERDGRSELQLAALRDAAATRGVHVIWSSVHLHLAPRIPDKGVGLLALLEQGGLRPAQVARTVVTVGDAPNDAGLFVGGRFAATVGTADVLRWLPSFPEPPQLRTAAPEVDGFLELVETLLDGRSSRVRAT
jgi:hydroxymethylpyrimidine pyrophosphatase-like HAD family hydrolase